jgi:hypothetical protein
MRCSDAAAALTQASAADLGAKYCETTNAYVAAGLDSAVGATKSALLSSGVADASAAAVALADRTVEASGVVGLTRKAVAAVGRAVDATAAVAERTGAADLTYRVTEASAAALAPAVAISQRAYGATVDATVAAADGTLNATLKAVAITNRAAEVLPQAVDIMGCVCVLPIRARTAGCLSARRGRARGAKPCAHVLLRPRTLTAAPRPRRMREELKELTQDSNERMLAALYPVRSFWQRSVLACSPCAHALGFLGLERRHERLRAASVRHRVVLDGHRGAAGAAAGGRRLRRRRLSARGGRGVRAARRLAPAGDGAGAAA